LYEVKKFTSELITVGKFHQTGYLKACCVE